MQELEQLVYAAQRGDLTAFSAVVNCFQDMAFGIAYARLGHVQLAEDAAQEAFIEAYLHLGSLQEPITFPKWFQTIVLRRCHRLTRRKVVELVALAAAEKLGSDALNPAAALEVRELTETVQRAIQTLPDEQRQVVSLFYIADYSQKEIADLLGLRPATVKSRLHTARRFLRERLITMTEETVRQQRPSKDNAFVQGVMEVITAIEQGDLAKVTAALQKRPELATATNTHGATALHYAAWHGAKEAATLLLAHGADIDLHDGKHDSPPIGWAGENGQRAMFDFLITQGAKVNIRQAAAFGDLRLMQRLLAGNGALVHFGTKDPDEGWSPLWAAALFKRGEIVDYLLAHGADIQATTRQGETPLHGAVRGGDPAIVERLLRLGANVNAQADKGITPLHWAAWQRSSDIVALLLANQARVDCVDQHGHTPLALASAAEGVTVEGWGSAAAVNPMLTPLLKHQV
jgi:RNA polymerase sigma factor (sigma-70 family)